MAEISNKQRMNKVEQKLKISSKTAVFCLEFVIIALFLAIGVKIARAAWEEPQATAPEGTQYAPLNVGPDKQAKKGRLLLDPFYNPAQALPQLNYQLEVRGPRDVYINNFDIASGGNLTVDTDTLFVNGADDRVGIGTTSPTAKLEVAGGDVTLGSASSPVNPTALVTNGASAYGLYGESQQVSGTSVSGVSVSGVGVYGLNTSSGAGIFAESLTGTAVVGSSSADFDPAAVVKKAGIYAKAQGLGAWAGYFEQRLASTAELVGRKFSPNRLQYSRFPYTAGWEVAQVSQSLLSKPLTMVYDGKNIWALAGDGGWDNEPFFYLIDPTTGALSEEFRLLGHYFGQSGATIDAHYQNEMIYAGGYIWTANSWDDSKGVSRIDPITRDTTIYRFGTNVDGNDGFIDLAYDTVTKPGTPYVWLVSYISEGSPVTISYQVTRLRPDTGEYGFCRNPLYDTSSTCTSNGSTWESYLTFNQTCPTLNSAQCSDGVDNDGNNGNNTDPECSSNDPLAQPCTVAGWETQALCTANGGTWNGDERYTTGQIGHSSGLTFDGTNVWVSFNGGTSNGGFQSAGLGKFQASDPYNVKNAFCIGINRYPDGITNGSGYLWTGNTRRNNSTWVSRLDPTNLNAPYVTPRFYDLSGVMTSAQSIQGIEYDDISSGSAPAYIWATNWDGLTKLTIDQATKNLSVANKYSLPAGVADMVFERTVAGGPYVWVSHSTTNQLTRNMINSPYSTTSFMPKGTSASGITFDGTYIWTANTNGNNISKYRASDGAKLGDYIGNWKPRAIVFDGVYLWTINDDTYDLTKIRASDGQKVDQFNYTSSGVGNDMTYDGKYIWVTDASNNTIRRIDTTVINSSSCVPGACAGYTGYSMGANFGPNKIVYDGQDIWVTKKNNSISRISTSGVVQQTITLTDVAASPDYNVQAILFDGTYLWVGTNKFDASGNSIYKINPNYAVGNEVVGKYKIFNDPGTCSAASPASKQYKYCRINSDCCEGASCGTCDNNSNSAVTALTFDGTNIWVKHGGRGMGGSRECTDGRDNDGDGKTDWGAGNDAQCTDVYDVHENDTGTECNDNLDNDGNGLCDFDGAVGSPGCSGKPDYGCASAADISEAVRSEWGYVTRIVASTGQVVESIWNTHYPYGASDVLFDGANIWTSDEAATYVLHKYFSGVGLETTDVAGVVSLQSGFPGTPQQGSFSMAGELRIGANLQVMGDLVVPGNTWAGTSDALKDFGTGCDNGSYMKGLNFVTGKVLCRGL